MKSDLILEAVRDSSVRVEDLIDLLQRIEDVQHDLPIDALRAILEEGQEENEELSEFGPWTPEESVASCNRVFVYGTLMSGLPNNFLLSGCKCLGSATMFAGWKMIDLGAFPALVQDSVLGEVVIGEIWEVDAVILAALDRLEGYPFHYDRKQVAVTCEKGDFQAWTYHYSADRAEELGSRPVVPGNDWRTHKAPHTAVFGR